MSKSDKLKELKEKLKISSLKEKASGAGENIAPENTKKKVRMVLVIAAIVVVSLITVFAVGIYKLGWRDRTTLAVSSVVPYPAFFVNGKTVTYDKYQNYLLAYETYIKEFYLKGEKKIDVNSDEAKKVLAEAKNQVKDLMVKNAIITQEARKRNVKYTQKEVDDAFNEFVTRTGGKEEVEKNLKKYYGLTTEEFKEQFFLDTFINGKLQEIISKDESLNAGLKEKSEQVLNEIKSGVSFKDAAKKYSDDEATASKGGGLGLVKKGSLIPEFEKAAWSLKKGQVSGLVKTLYGYHIITVTKIKGESRQISHILLKSKDYETWLDEQVKSAKVDSWIK